MAFTITPAIAFVKDHSNVAASILNTWRTNISRAIDGNAGGTYTPTAPVIVNNGGGTSAIETNDIDLTGIAAFTVGASMRLVKGAIIADAADKTLDPDDGLVQYFAQAAADRYHDVVAAGTSGRFFVLIKDNLAGFTINIHRTGHAVAAGDLIRLPAASWCSVILYDDGANWRVMIHVAGTIGTLA